MRVPGFCPSRCFKANEPDKTFCDVATRRVAPSCGDWPVIVSREAGTVRGGRSSKGGVQTSERGSIVRRELGRVEGTQAIPTLSEFLATSEARGTCQSILTRGWGVTLTECPFGGCEPDPSSPLSSPSFTNAFVAPRQTRTPSASVTDNRCHTTIPWYGFSVTPAARGATSAEEISTRRTGRRRIECIVAGGRSNEYYCI